nr:regulatory protein NPR3-like [Ipomoea batatas]
MENGEEFSSSMNFASSSSLSNGPHMPSCSGSVEFLSLNELSSGLEKLLTDAEFDYSDAEIVVEGVSVGVNRCILAARSRFFHDKFKKERGNQDSAKEPGKSRILMTELVPCGKVGYEAFLTVLNYLYTGKLRTYAPEVSTCVDESCAHHACRPAIDYAVELMYASATFQSTELVMVFQRHLFSLLDEALEDDVFPILLVAFRCSLGQLLEQCVQRITRSNIGASTLEKELPYEVLSEIRASRATPVVVDSVKEKRIGKLVKALDSDDIELVKLLLEESNVSLDDACALHFAAAYCTPKIVNQVLSLGLADPNRRNVQGYTALHVAARRRDLSIIVGLLSNGASVVDAAMNGQTAVTICRRLTRPKEYYKAPKHGQETSNDWLCIDVLEREMLRNPICLRNLSQPSSSMLDEELVMDLYILENRVALARVLFPREAKLAMEMARADSTSEFAGLSSTEGNPRCLDPKELPPFQVKQLKDRMEALQNTVVTGRRFFPNCSEVLDKLLDDVFVHDAAVLDSGTPEEQKIKRVRYTELKNEIMKAFDRDKAEMNSFNGFSPSSSSSTSAKISVSPKGRRR